MKWFSALVIFCLFVCTYSWRILHGKQGRGGFLGKPLADDDTSQDLYFEQKLDHFNPSDVRTWKQRYFENFDHFKTGGPIFLMINGEAEASVSWVKKGAWIDYAKKYNALCILLEHRFYGKSHPTEDMSTKNLAHLSSEQALADVAWFISSYSQRKHFDVPSKWIVFGGSYAGSLAAWMRLKYPHLVQGAVSSSGPLLALSDFKEYFAVVHDSLSTYSPKCVTAIETATSQLSALLQSSGGNPILNLFNLCDPLDTNKPEDVSNFYTSLAEIFAYVVQYDNLKRHMEGRIVQMSIEQVCLMMLNKTIGTELHRLAAVNAHFLKVMNEPCLDFVYEKMIEEMRGTSWKGESAVGGRQWTYQTCSEFGFFATSDLNETAKLFGDKFPLEFFNKQCTDIFGKKFDSKFIDDAIKATNMIYGALDNQAANVVYVHGSIDPWHALGITHTLKSNAPAIFINGTAHCANMFESSPDDPPQLVSARKQIEELIGKWLAQ